MGRKPTDSKQQEEFLRYLRAGRDEMNLLEHSISSASTKVDRETRSLVFARQDFDPDTREPIERSWEVSFSKFGRPTITDDDVFVALLRLSAVDDFATRKVEFTRYEICKILGWSDCGKSYKAIDDALRRLTGVYIVATNFWYDNKAKGWRDRNFHIFDSSEVFKREQYDQERRADGVGPRSWFVWSETMKESFDAGYIRKLDLDEYLSLANPVARKLYRYLGKQFYYRTNLSINLRTLCCDKLGYRHGTELNELRRKVLPAIEQLESRGCYGLSHQFNAGYGKCEVVFTAKRKSSETPKESPAASPLVEHLVKHGVDRKDALSAAKRLTPERILADVEHVEHEAKAGRIKASKAGMLAAMLKSDDAWPRPQGFVSSVDRKAAAEKAAKIQADRAKTAVAVEERKREAEEREEAAFIEFMAEFSDDERLAFEQSALAENNLCRGRYEKAKADGDSDRMGLYLKTALQVAWKKSLTIAKRGSPAGTRRSQSTLGF